jgi:ribosomal protein L11 methyltransferase
VDIDPSSVQASRENATANGIPLERFDIGLGSVTEVLAGDFDLRVGRLVLANILAPTIIHLFDLGLARMVEKGGDLVLAGILQEQVGSVEKAINTSGMVLNGKRQIEDWVALKCTPGN